MYLHKVHIEQTKKLETGQKYGSTYKHLVDSNNYINCYSGICGKFHLLMGDVDVLLPIHPTNYNIYKTDVSLVHT